MPERVEMPPPRFPTPETEDHTECQVADREDTTEPELLHSHKGCNERKDDRVP